MHSPSQVEARVAIADEAAVVEGRSPLRSVSLAVSPDAIPGMEGVAMITGDTGEIVDSLASFAEAGFDEVLCYGPAPSAIGSDSWRPIVEAAHAL